MVSFKAHDDGIEVIDPIERRRLRVTTARPVEPTPVDTDRFTFPVDEAVSIATDTVAVDGVADSYVRTDGEMVAAVRPDAPTELPPDSYEVEVNAPVKLYFRSDGALTVTADGDRVQLSFDGDVLVGARSYHERPAATITTTSDSEDALRALSYLGSALKTTSPERSYPTLRGHPPTVEVGESFAVPDALSKPDTGVEVVVPPTHRAAVVAAPLAFYLGADLVPGTDPRVVTDDLAFPLDSSADSDYSTIDAPGDADGFERAVERVLKQTFFFDCLTRTEGYYEVDLHERAAVEPHVDLDFSALYDATLAERLEAYLSVPFDTVAPHLPRWNVAAFVEPTAAGVEALPFVVGDLAVVRPAEGESVSAEEMRSTVVDDYMDDLTRGPDRTDDGDDLPSLVRPPQTDAVEVAWFGEGVPVGASKATTAAFHNWFDRRPDAGDIDIAVVCNDDAMRAENDVVTEAYGSREDLPFEVTLHRDLTTAELRDVLTEDADFLHYIGHIDADGFDCDDGALDATTLDSVGVDAFLLNACRSYDQGMALVEAGSVGGVVTFSEVVDSGAVRVGATMARLLDRGFPLRPALEIARGESIVGGHYTVVGDGRVAVVQSDGGLSMLCELAAVGTDAYDVTFRTYPPREGGMGTLARPTVPGTDCYFLAPGAIGPFRMSSDAVREYLDHHRYPVEIKGELGWTPDALDRYGP